MLQAVHGWSSTYERLVKSQKFFSSYLTQEDLSRFGRDYIETGNYLETIFPMLHIRFIAINDDFDNIRQSDVDSLAVPMRAVLFCAFYCEIMLNSKADKNGL